MNFNEILDYSTIGPQVEPEMEDVI